MNDQEYEKMIDSIVVPEDEPDKNKLYKRIKDFLAQETPESLYRFRCCHERSFDEFERDILGFAPAEQMNDDFDGVIYFDKEKILTNIYQVVTAQNTRHYAETMTETNVPPGAEAVLSPQLVDFIKTVIANLPDESLELILQQLYQFATFQYDERMELISHLTQKQKIACFSTAINSAAMWGYYADSGKGFALAYDLRNIGFDVCCLAKMIYSDKRVDATEYAKWLLQTILYQNIYDKFGSTNPLPAVPIQCPDMFMCTKALLHKASCWRHEQEWRLMLYETHNPNHLSYPSIIHRPTALYLGKNISAIHEKILRHIAVEKHIPVYKMAIDSNSRSYALEPRI